MSDRRAIYFPKWDGPIEGYVMNFLRANFWRVSATMEFEDCTQEAHCLFLRLAQKYSPIDTPQHFMSLFKISWINHFNDLSTLDFKLRRMIAMSYESSEEESTNYEALVDQLVGDLDTSGHLYQMVMQAPQDVRTVLSFILNAPDHLVNAVCESWTGSPRRQRKGNSILCKYLGFPEDRNLLGDLVRYFGV